MPTTRRWLPGGALVIALGGCGANGPAAPGAAPLAMPVEADGLVPGASTEADVVKAWPAATIKRDRGFGGDGMVGYNGLPAVEMEVAPKHAWLVALGGPPRLVVLDVPIARDCAEVMPSLAPRREYGPCYNRGAGPREYATCTRTADGKRRLEISCFDREAIHYRVDFDHGTYGM